MILVITTAAISAIHNIKLPFVKIITVTVTVTVTFRLVERYYSHIVVTNVPTF